MKRFNIMTTILLVAIFLVVFAANVGAQDKKETKQEVKAQKTEKQACDPKNCANACQGKHEKGECKDHDPSKCNHEKCNCNLKPGSKECLEKYAKNKCIDHKPGECCQPDQTKKPAEKKKD